MRFTAYFMLMVTMITLGACKAGSVKTDDPDMPANAYLEGKNSNVGVILCHGRGHYPTWLVVNPLRKGIHEKLGYHTLSIQMPTGNVNWREYEAFFPDAHKRITAAMHYLRETKNVDTIYLMGHSMGTRMVTSYLADNPDADVAGFIGVGTRNGGGRPLDSKANLANIDIPVVDIYGDGGNAKDARHANARSHLVDDNYQQILIPGANHKFTAHESELVDVTVSWLKQQANNQ